MEREKAPLYLANSSTSGGVSPHCSIAQITQTLLVVLQCVALSVSDQMRNMMTIFLMFCRTLLYHGSARQSNKK